MQNYKFPIMLTILFCFISCQDLTREDVVSKLEKKESLKGANLKGLNLSELNLIMVDFSDANLVGANLKNANLRGANLAGANLSGANLSDANLKDCNLEKAKLNRTNLSKAILIGSKMVEVEMNEADLAGADLTDVNLTNAILNNVDFTNIKNNLDNIKDIKDINPRSTKLFQDKMKNNYPNIPDNILLRILEVNESGLLTQKYYHTDNELYDFGIMGSPKYGDNVGKMAYRKRDGTVVPIEGDWNKK